MVWDSSIDKNLKSLLDAESERINCKEFILNDPIQFPRRFDKQQDIEIVGLLSAIIAWGKRSMICRDAERLLQIMNSQPYNYVMDRAYEEIDDKQNIHRTMFGSHLKYFLRGLNAVYKKYNTLDSFSMSVNSGANDFPSWHFVEALQQVMSCENKGATCSQCLPTDLNKTALKRINMALRWFVRDDGIVDIGIWHSIPKSKLYIPLDVHVGNTSRKLGLIERKANDKRTVVELTEKLRIFRPDDPGIYDYALFGIGVGE